MKNNDKIIFMLIYIDDLILTDNNINMLKNICARIGQEVCFKGSGFTAFIS